MTAAPTVTIKDTRAVLYVFVDYGYAEGPVFSLSVPSGRLAGYPEARARGYAEARAKVEAHRDAILERYASGPRVCAHRNVIEPSETEPVLERCGRSGDARGYCDRHGWLHS